LVLQWSHNTFTGIIHDYVGGGNNQEGLIFQDKWIPKADKQNECLEWDEQVKMFNSLAPCTVEQIEDKIDQFICYDTDISNYVPQNGTMRYYQDKVLIDNMSKNVPYGLGNTSFIDGYKIQESLDYKDTTNDILCPACGNKLKYAMMDIDGTNLEEVLECTECGYYTFKLDENYS